MENPKQTYKLTPERIAGLYNQEYLRQASKGEKFKSLDGGLQRAVIEEALLETEAMKLSRTYGEDAREKETAYFEKYLEFYAYQAAREPARFRERESDFLRIHISKASRDAAREIEIKDRAGRIDSFRAAQELSTVKNIIGTRQR